MRYAQMKTENRSHCHEVQLIQLLLPNVIFKNPKWRLSQSKLLNTIKTQQIIFRNCLANERKLGIFCT